MDFLYKIAILVTLKIEFHVSRCEGVYAESQTTLLYMKGLNKIESPVFVLFVCSVSPKATL